MPKLARNTPHATRRLNLNTKVLPEIRSALLDAAEANGRPLSAEVEARLLASFAPAPDLRAIIREEIRAALAERGSDVWLKNAVRLDSAGPPRFSDEDLEALRHSLTNWSRENGCEAGRYRY